VGLRLEVKYKSYIIAHESILKYLAENGNYQGVNIFLPRLNEKHERYGWPKVSYSGYVKFSYSAVT